MTEITYEILPILGRVPTETEVELANQCAELSERSAAILEVVKVASATQASVPVTYTTT